MSSGLKGYSKPWGDGTPKWVRDAALNDSDKTMLTVPAGKQVEIIAVQATFITTATVGNRALVLSITDGTNEVWLSYINIQAANLTYVYQWAPLLPNDVTATYLSNPIPALVLRAGYVVRVYDSNAVDAAADDLTVVLHYVEYDA